MCKCHSQPTAFTVLSVKEENYRIKTFEIDAEFKKAKAGQFVMVWLPGEKEAPFCIADICPLTLTIANAGDFTDKLHKVKKGEKIWIRGPLGKPFKHEEKSTKPILVGGGYGSAPLAFLARNLKNNNCKPTAVIGGKTSKDIIGIDKFRNIDVSTEITTENGSSGTKGLVTGIVEQMLETGSADAIYAIGPNPMLKALEKISKKFNVPCQLSWEQHIGCGIGICGMCEHEDGSLICKEGPVRKVAF